MMLSATCPECGKTLEVTDEASGHPLCCPHCHHEFAAPEVLVVASTDETPSDEGASTDKAPSDEGASTDEILSDEEAAATRPRRRLREKDDFERKRRRPPPPRKLSILLIIALVTGGLILSCTGLGVGGYFLFIHEIEVPVTASDRSLVITAKRIGDFVPTLKVDPAHDTFHKVRMLDGSRELTYEYSSTDNDDGALYVNHQVCVDRTVDGAKGAYVGLHVGIKYFGFREIREVERNELWKWGDASKCILLMKGDRKVGNLFTARKGRRYFMLMIAGVYFEETGAIRDLLNPFLQRFDAYEG